MGYSAKAPANYFIRKHGTSKISPLKLQKLVYISHGWHLAIFDEELVDDEYVEAWRYGPVFPSLYYEFKRFGADPIPVDQKATEFSPDFESVVPVIRESDNRTPALLERVWDVYGTYTPSELSALTHAQGTPWHTIWNKNPGMRNMHIPNELIKDYYKGLAKQRPEGT